MKKNLLILILYMIAMYAAGQGNRVTVRNNADGMTLMVDGKEFMINGVNWDYVPIGTTITDPGIWSRSDDVIMAALDAEMALLKNMGVNAIRTYDLDPKWVRYIYENYGIYTMLNITFGAYGLTINGAWTPQTDYADPATREVLMAEAINMANTYKDTPGLLLYMIGNENNYHLSWSGAETEAIPIEGVDSEKIKAARALYKALNDATIEVKKIDQTHPVAICNGDMLYSDIVAQECKDIDIYGTNMYRGISFGDAFQRIKDELNLPVLFAEFGGDAFNARDNKEDQYSQAYYNLGNWKEIYANAAGIGGAQNSLGGFTFQFSDGWWKYKQTENLDVHDNVAVWPNGGYSRDQENPGDLNMNEEWFGICAKGPTDQRGLYTLYPRAAYYALKEAHQLNPYASGVDLAFVENHFDNIQIFDAELRARADKAALNSELGGKIRISEIRAEFSTFMTGGDKITTERPDLNPGFPNKLGFDRMESYFVGIEAKPDASVRANVVFNVLGNVAENPINEIFYENRGRAETFISQSGNEVTTNPNRVQVYQADYSWDHKYFKLDGFYRTGHYHWGYEGDFFGLYPEANYGPNIDIYGGFAPNGFEIEGKKSLTGLKVAFGPELWWGANPAVLLKYTKEIKGVEVTGIFHEDLEEPGSAVSSIAVPQPKTRRASIYASKKLGDVGVEVGGLWGGDPLVGRNFDVVRGQDGVYNQDYFVLEDVVRNSDTWGGKVKLTYQAGPISWYGQASSRGLVANAGGDYTQTFTGWRLKDFGSGNVNNVFTGFAYTVGNFQIAPNFMWQQPIIDPIEQFALEDGSPARLRNILDDPFVVRSNRETRAAELLITFDPTPGTWMYSWDSDRVENSKLAVSLGFVYWNLPTSQDAAVIFPGTGRVPAAAAGAAPAEDLWEVNARIVSKLSPEFGIIANVYGGTAQANGGSGDASDAVNRTIERYGGTVRAIYKKVKIQSHVKVNDWGPFDYFRDFNLTYPLQVMADVSTSISKPDWFLLPSTQLGMRFTWRSLNQFSNRYAPAYTTDEFTGDIIPDPAAPGFGNGNEWELRTYLHINLGN